MSTRQLFRGLLLFLAASLLLAVASWITDDVPPDPPQRPDLAADLARLQCRADEIEPLLTAVEAGIARRELERRLFPGVDP